MKFLSTANPTPPPTPRSGEGFFVMLLRERRLGRKYGISNA